MSRVTIVGGGISGLAAAYRLSAWCAESGQLLEITVLEGSDRFGGVIRTEAKGGFLMEGGPDAFLSEKPWALELAGRMGLAGELIPTRPEMRRSFILHRGKLEEVPEGFYLLAPSHLKSLLKIPCLSWRGRLRVACDLVIPETGEQRDESVGDFVRRRFGREALEKIAQPMIGGIYAGDVDRLSIEATFPRFREMARAHGSVIRALGRQTSSPSARYLFSALSFPRKRESSVFGASWLKTLDPGFRRDDNKVVTTYSAHALGLQSGNETGGFAASRPSAHALGLQDDNETGSFAASGPIAHALGLQSGNETGSFAASGPRYGMFLSFENGMETLVRSLVEELHGVALRTNSRVQSLKFDGVWRVALETGEVLESDALCLALPSYEAGRLLRFLDQDLARELEAIPYESVATVNLAYRTKDLARPLRGFGFVVPRREGRNLLGCTYASVKFPGRAPEDAVLIRAFAGGAFQRGIMDKMDEEIQYQVRQEIREILGIAKEPVLTAIHRHPLSMPQYHVGHLERILRIEERVRRIEGLYLTGNWLHGVGIPDCIRQAESTANAIAVSIASGVLHGI